MSSRILNDREINTILHALRILQEMREPVSDGRGCKDAESRKRFRDGSTACDHFEEGLKPLDNTELDALCESIGLDLLTLDLDDEEANPLDQAYRDAADKKFGSDGQIEIDDNAAVSGGVDDGAYVQAWVWVEGDLVPNVCNGDGCKVLVKSGDDYYGSPCGTYCEECMHAHVKVCGECAREFDLEMDEEESDD